MNATAEQTGNDLYQEVIAYDYASSEQRDLMEKVWSYTPWMADVYDGQSNSERRIDMLHWCKEHFGPECWPIHGHPGDWQRGGVTMFGWTWYGFAAEEMLREFLGAWPTPEGVEKR